MKQNFVNAPTPTLFDLFLTETGDTSAIEHKRFVKRVCEAVTASIGRRVRFRAIDNAGQQVIGGVVTDVPGFVIFAECSDEGQTYAEDKRRLMSEWWTGGGYEQVSPYRVAKVASHALAYECDFGNDIEEFVTDTLGLHFMMPEAWTKREERSSALATLTAERQARREARAATKAQKALEAAKASAVEVCLEQALASVDASEAVAA